MNSWKRRFGLLISIILVLILSACGNSGTTTTTANGTTTTTTHLTIIVGGLSKQIYLPNELAQRLGYFTQQGLDVSLVDETSGQASTDAVLAGQVEAGSGSYNNPTTGRRFTGRWQSGQLHQAVNLASSEFGGSNPSLPSIRFKFHVPEFQVRDGVDLEPRNGELETVEDAGVAQR